MPITLLNPFRVESPEKLSPDNLVSLFVERFTRLETIKQRKHTFLWGSRGAGKSMLLRYLEPRCQAQVHLDFRTFLQSEEPFVAVYCPCKEGQINKTDLQLLNSQASLILTEHLLNLHIADLVVGALIAQLPTGFLDPTKCRTFAQRVSRLFDRASIATSLRDATEVVSIDSDPLSWFQEICQSERRLIANFLRNYTLSLTPVTYSGATSGYHDFLLPFFQEAQRLISEAVPIYILLDDADRLTKEQQGIINTWVANRDQAIVCFKIGAQRDAYQTFRTREGGLIEQPHDYSEVDVDELYTHSKSDYYEKVRLIADRRLGLSAVPTKDVTAFLPADASERKLFEQIKQDTATEWIEAGRPGRQDDFVYRYATARLFQNLKSRKQEKNYAGFNNLVHLSSGVIRDFLEPCYLMFDDVISRDPNQDNIKVIPSSVQDKIVKKYSEDFLLSRFEDFRKDLPPEQWSILDALRVLLESLGRLFYERLHDPDAREARLFSFTVRGKLSSLLSDVLRLGVKYRCFQLRTYSTKEGGGRENWYVLNRRLCPKFKLDPTGFEGRISLTPDLLDLACKDPTRFVRLRLKLDTEDVGQGDLFELISTE